MKIRRTIVLEVAFLVEHGGSETLRLLGTSFAYMRHPTRLASDHLYDSGVALVSEFLPDLA